MMQVILLERIEKLGQMGDVVTVKPGYARNYLLPQRKALRATKDNLSYFENQRAQLETVNLARRTEAESVAGKMTDVSVVIIRQAGDSGQLYGSVSGRDIAEALTESGYTVERRQVAIDKPIKTLGLFGITLALHPEVKVQVTVNVARSADEAELQAKHGGMVTGDMLEEEEAEDEVPESTEPAAEVSTDEPEQEAVSSGA